MAAGPLPLEGPSAPIMSTSSSSAVVAGALFVCDESEEGLVMCKSGGGNQKSGPKLHSAAPPRNTDMAGK